MYGKSMRVNKFVTNWDLRVVMLHSIRSCRLLVYLCGILCAFNWVRLCSLVGVMGLFL